MKKLTKYFWPLPIPDNNWYYTRPHNTNDIWGRENNYAGQLVCKHKPDVVCAFRLLRAYCACMLWAEGLVLVFSSDLETDVTAFTRARTWSWTYYKLYDQRFRNCSKKHVNESEPAEYSVWTVIRQSRFFTDYSIHRNNMFLGHSG